MEGSRGGEPTSSGEEYPEMLETEIGLGCFGTCFLVQYGARTVVVKQQQDCLASKHETRMISRRSHPNTVCFIGIVERESSIDIVTNFYHINGERLNLDDFPVENTSIDWTHLLSGLFSGVRHSHDSVKILHNDIKLNNVVLDRPSLVEAEAVLIDLGKATDQSSPKTY